MTDTHLTPHGRVLVALADELAKLAAIYASEIADPEADEGDEWLHLLIGKASAESFAARLNEAARIAGSLSTELLSTQTGRE